MSETDVLKFVGLAWENRGHKAPFSWDRVNRTMRSAILLAVEVGFEFTRDDLLALYHPKRYHASYYLDIEGFYGVAVTTNNRSAARAAEAYLGRKPFIFVDIEPPTYAYGQARAYERKRGRLAIGYWFTWKDERVRVTSFSEDGSYLVACSYKGDEVIKQEADDRVLRPGAREIIDEAAYWQSEKIKHRYKLTPKDLRDEARNRKGAKDETQTKK